MGKIAIGCLASTLLSLRLGSSAALAAEDAERVRDAFNGLTDQ